MRVGRALSAELGASVIHAEATDDLWGGYVVFDSGQVVECSWLGVGDDLMRVGRDLGLELPPIPEDRLYHEVSYFWSVDDAVDCGDLNRALVHVGARLDGAANPSGDVVYLVGSSS